MKTPLRIAIGAVTAVAVFAASFAVASALVTPPELSPADPPLAIPPYTREQAEVLIPVSVGDALGDPAGTEGDQGLSDTGGIAEVVVPESVAGLDPEDPSPEDIVAPELIEATAALDSVAGDPSELAGAAATPPTEPDPTAPGEATPASDPCAMSDAPPAEGDEDTDGCPEGASMTLLTLDGELQVWARADVPTSFGMGSSIWCEPADLPEGALSLGAMATDSADVTVTYWPEGSPSDTTTVQLTQVQEWEDGSTRLCGATEPLEPGDYEAEAWAISDEAVATPDEFTFDSRGAPTVPTMRIVPLGRNWVWVGMLHTTAVRAWVTGWQIGDDDSLTCEDHADAPYLRTDVDSHTSEVSAEYLEARNYQSPYTRVTSALFYVPPGSRALVCGTEWRDREPSWDASVADRVQSAVVESPGGWTAVSTLRHLRVFAPGAVSIRAASQTGQSCGRAVFVGFEVERSDTPSDFPRDDEL